MWRNTFPKVANFWKGTMNCKSIYCDKIDPSVFWVKKAVLCCAKRLFLLYFCNIIKNKMEELINNYYKEAVKGIDENTLKDVKY
jgi:hypothetical protein